MSQDGLTTNQTAFYLIFDGRLYWQAGSLSRQYNFRNPNVNKTRIPWNILILSRLGIDLQSSYITLCLSERHTNAFTDLCACVLFWEQLNAEFFLRTRHIFLTGNWHCLLLNHLLLFHLPFFPYIRIHVFYPGGIRVKGPQYPLLSQEQIWKAPQRMNQARDSSCSKAVRTELRPRFCSPSLAKEDVSVWLKNSQERCKTVQIQSMFIFFPENTPCVTYPRKNIGQTWLPLL
jgi:hypothetical protein